MSNNPEQNTQLSAEPERTAPVPGDSPATAVGAETAEPAPHLPSLLKEAEDEAARLKDAWLRAKAETENIRKQAQNDLAKAHKYAIERFAQELLTVRDALELTDCVADVQGGDLGRADEARVRLVNRLERPVVTHPESFAQHLRGPECGAPHSQRREHKLGPDPLLV